MEARNVDKAEEVRQFPHGHSEIVEVGGASLQRATFEAGWRWSTDIKPIAGTDSCQVHHVGYVLSGRMKLEMDDGAAAEVGPGDVFDIPPGHDGWVLGDEECVLLDWGPGVAGYAKSTS